MSGATSRRCWTGSGWASSRRRGRSTPASPGARGGLLEGDGRPGRRTGTPRRRRWPRRSIAGWPTSRCGPTASRRRRGWPGGAGGTSRSWPAPRPLLLTAVAALSAGIVLVGREQQRTERQRQRAEEQRSGRPRDGRGHPEGRGAPPPRRGQPGQPGLSRVPRRQRRPGRRAAGWLPGRPPRAGNGPTPAGWVTPS